MAIIERENVAANPRGALNATSGWGGAGAAGLVKGYAAPGEQAYLERTVTNLVGNPSFEYGIDGVSSSGSLATSQTTAGGAFALEGTCSLRLVVGAGAGIFTFAYQQVTGLVAGEYLGASFWFRSSGGTYPAASRVIFFDDANTNVGTSDWSPTATSPNDWVEVRLPAQPIPAGATKANVYFYVGDPANGVLPVEGAVYDTDCWRAFTMPTAEEVNQALADRYFDGDVWYPEVIEADWDGASGASPSTAHIASDAVVNQVWNPRAVDGNGPNPWSSANATEGYVTGLSQDLIPGLTTGWRYTRDVASGNVVGAFDDDATLLGYNGPRPGEPWAGGVLVIPSASGRSIRAHLRWGDASNTYVSYSLGPAVVTVAGEPVWVSVAGVAPAQARTVAVGFSNDGGAGTIAVGDTFDMTAGLLTPGRTTAPTVEDYFDGSFGREGDLHDRYWSSLPNASPSVRALAVFSPEEAAADVGFAYGLAAEGGEVASYARHALLSNFSPVEPGTRYGASMWMLTAGAVGGLQQRIRGSWRDAAGQPIPGAVDFDVQIDSTPAEGWTFYSGSTPVAPEGAALLSLFPWWYRGSGDVVEWGGALAWTQAMLEPGVVPPGPYFDGEMENTLDAFYYTDGQGVSHAVINTRPGKGAWGIELDGVSLEGGDGIVPTLLSISDLDGIVGCLNEPPDGMGLPPRRTQDVVLAQRDGVAMLADFYENRIITIKATVSASGCEGCPTAKQNVRKLLRAWARYCTQNSALRIFTDCHGQGDIADVGPFWAIGRGRAAEVVWRPGGVQVADVTLRFDCVDHLLRFNPTGDPFNVIQTVDVSVLDQFLVNYFPDPRAIIGNSANWTWANGQGGASTVTLVKDAEDGWPIYESGIGGMETDGLSAGSFNEQASTYYRRRMTTAGTTVANLTMTSTLVADADGQRVTGRFWVRASRAVEYAARAGINGAGTTDPVTGTLQPGVWTLLKVSHEAINAGGTTAYLYIRFTTAGVTMPLDLDVGGVVVQDGDEPDIFFDGTPGFIPTYNSVDPNYIGFGWPLHIDQGPPVAVNRYSSQFAGAPNASDSIVGVSPTVPVEVSGDVCVKMEVQFEGKLTAPIYLVDVANSRWVGYALDVLDGETAIWDTNTGRMFHAAASASGDTSYALSGDTFMALDPQSGLTANFQLWTGDMENDTGLARIYWSDAVLGI